MAIDEKTADEKSLRRQFELVLRLRRNSRTAKVDADTKAAECEHEWLLLKEMLRADGEPVGSQS